MTTLSRRIAAAKRSIAKPESVAAQQRAARRLQSEWQTYLAHAEFAASEDALSHTLISLEEAGLEEANSEPLFGLDANQGHGVCAEVAWWLDGYADLDNQITH